MWPNFPQKATKSAQIKFSSLGVEKCVRIEKCLLNTNLQISTSSYFLTIADFVNRIPSIKSSTHTTHNDLLSNITYSDTLPIVSHSILYGQLVCHSSCDCSTHLRDDTGMIPCVIINSSLKFLNSIVLFTHWNVLVEDSVLLELDCKYGIIISTNILSYSPSQYAHTSLKRALDNKNSETKVSLLGKVIALSPITRATRSQKFPKKDKIDEKCSFSKNISDSSHHVFFIVEIMDDEGITVSIIFKGCNLMRFYHFLEFNSWYLFSDLTYRVYNAPSKKAFINFQTNPKSSILNAIENEIISTSSSHSLLEYNGVVTKQISRFVFELNGSMNVYITHISCDILSSFRVGALVRLTNFHEIHRAGVLIGLGCCMHSMVSIQKFSFSSLSPTPPRSRLSSLFPHMNIADVAYLIDSINFLKHKFKPKLLKGLLGQPDKWINSREGKYKGTFIDLMSRFISFDLKRDIYTEFFNHDTSCLISSDSEHILPSLVEISQLLPLLGKEQSISLSFTSNPPILLCGVLKFSSDNLQLLDSSMSLPIHIHGLSFPLLDSIIVIQNFVLVRDELRFSDPTTYISCNACDIFPLSIINNLNHFEYSHILSISERSFSSTNVFFKGLLWSIIDHKAPFHVCIYLTHNAGDLKDEDLKNDFQSHYLQYLLYSGSFHLLRSNDFILNDKKLRITNSTPIPYDYVQNHFSFAYHQPPDINITSFRGILDFQTCSKSSLIFDSTMYSIRGVLLDFSLTKPEFLQQAAIKREEYYTLLIRDLKSADMIRVFFPRFHWAMAFLDMNQGSIMRIDRLQRKLTTQLEIVLVAVVSSLPTIDFESSFSLDLDRSSAYDWSVKALYEPILFYSLNLTYFQDFTIIPPTLTLKQTTTKFICRVTRVISINIEEKDKTISGIFTVNDGSSLATLHTIGDSTFQMLQLSNNERKTVKDNFYSVSYNVKFIQDDDKSDFLLKMIQFWSERVNLTSKLMTVFCKQCFCKEVVIEILAFLDKGLDHNYRNLGTRSFFVDKVERRTLGLPLPTFELLQCEPTSILLETSSFNKAKYG